MTGKRNFMSIEEILLAFRAGELELEETRKLLHLLSIDEIDGMANLDLLRKHRSGVPEVIYSDTKTPEDAALIALKMFEKNGYAFLTRVTEDHYQAVLDRMKNEDISCCPPHYNKKARTIFLASEDFYHFSGTGNAGQPGNMRTMGKVGIITAGTSDIPVAEEAREACLFMGCEVMTSYDVGIAGLHRIFQPLRNMLESDVRAIIVIAGMEGALPSVVASMVDIPVIGVPCSVGYGFGGKGKAALMSMLQSCSPGLVVVDIDNGFGAGVSAALMVKSR